MPQRLRTLAALPPLLGLAALQAYAQTGIGTTSPHASAALEVSSTSRGLLIPRLTEAQRTAVASPAVGLMVYQTDGAQPGFWYFTSPGGWTFLNPTGADNLGSHTATQNLGLNNNWLSNDGGNEGIRIDNAGSVGIGITAPTALLDVNGSTRLRGLAGTGTRMVMTDASGNLSGASTGASNGVFWGLSGNSGTSPATHFVGTTDAQDLVFRTSNTERMRLRQNGGLTLVGVGDNTFVGENAGAATTGGNNVYVGDGAGAANVAGADNVAVGLNAGINSSATSTTMVGTLAGAGSGGFAGTFIGGAAGFQTTGNANTFIGYSAGMGNTTGQFNVALGYLTGQALGNGLANTLIGSGAGQQLAGTTGNTLLGYAAGQGTTTGSNNIFIGLQTANTNTTGSDNTIIGVGADVAAANLQYAAAIGRGAVAGASNVMVLGAPSGSVAAVSVGIGTGTPLTRLSVSPSAAEPKITLYDGGSAANHYGFGISPSQLNYHVDNSTSRHVFYAAGKNGDGTELMRIQGNGNVGIGNNLPAARLDVAGSSTAPAILATSSNAGGAGIRAANSANGVALDVFSGLLTLSTASAAAPLANTTLTPTTVIQTYTGNGSPSVNGLVSLAAGADGQVLIVTNLDPQNLTVGPVTLPQNTTRQLVYASGSWRALN